MNIAGGVEENNGRHVPFLVFMEGPMQLKMYYPTEKAQELAATVANIVVQAAAEATKMNHGGLFMPNLSDITKLNGGKGVQDQ